MSSLSAQGSRVVLIGTKSCADDSDLPEVPAVTQTLDDLWRILIDRCNLDEAQVKYVLDPPSPMEMGLRIVEQAELAEDVLLVYYVGHGFVSPGGELYLATRATDRRENRLEYTSLAYSAIRSNLSRSRAQSVVVVLDCCFSGRAIGILGADNDASDLAHIHGGYVLTSAARDELALAPVGAEHTAFSGELIRLLNEGDPGGPPQLTVRHAYRYLSRALPARGFPRPRQRAGDWIQDMVLAPNPAYRAGLAPSASDPESGQGGDAPDVCPYPGLAAFGPEDRKWFFGREQLTQELVERLAERIDEAHPLLVAGPSGAGKSSLLGAGLPAALDSGRFPGASSWPRLLFTPTDHPIRELAARLAPLTGPDADALHGELLDAPNALTSLARGVLQSRAGEHSIVGTRLVLVVDQFEEVFTQCTDDRQRDAFIRALCVAAGGGDGSEPPVLVVLGVRADFLGHCTSYPDLRPALQKGPIVVGPMTMAEVRDAIEKPAELAGLILQPGLVETLLADLGIERGAGNQLPAPREPVGNERALPLLAHALEVTWQERAVRTLTIAGYQIVGGIWNAIATTADDAYDALSETEQDIARRLLLRMVQLSEDTEATRRRRDRPQVLEALPDHAIATRVLHNLAKARLITLDAATAEITHEALLRAWPRLQKWIEDEREARPVHQRLSADARVWDEQGRRARLLYRGTALAIARDWSDDPDHRASLDSVEQTFIDSSIDAETRRQSITSRSVVRLRLVTAVLTVLLVIGAGTIIYQWSGRCGPGVTRGDDGECVGVTDGSYAFPGLSDVTSKIKAENDSIEGESGVTIAVLMPMTPGRSTHSIEQIRSNLEGAYIAQREANDSSGLKFRLVLANEGSAQQAWQPVIQQLAQMLNESQPLVAVAGLGPNSGPTVEGAKLLSRFDIPIVGSTPGTAPAQSEDSTVDVFRISPSSSTEIDGLVRYWESVPGPKKPMLVSDINPRYFYTKALTDGFKEKLALDKEIRYDSSAPGATAFEGSVRDLCRSASDTVFYAGRAGELPDLIQQLRQRGCAADRPITVVTGSQVADLPGTLPKPGPSDAPVRVVYTNIADPTALADPAMNRYIQLYRRFEQAHASYFGGSARINGWAVLAHDAVLTAVVATVRVNFRSRVPSPLNVGEGLLLLGDPRDDISGAGGRFTIDPDTGDAQGRKIPIMELRPDGATRLIGM